jgi:hypothetical protein
MAEEDNKGAEFISRADEELSLLEKALRLIPGYRGYSKKEKLRDTDKLVRETLFQELKIVSRNLSAAFEMLVMYDRDYRDVDRVNLALDTFSTKVRHAPHGYSGLFDPIKVGEDDIERIISFDVSMLERASQLVDASEQVKNAAKKEEDVFAAQERVSSLFDELTALFDARASLIHDLPE